MNVTGRGNFDRVSSNGLPASADWKGYKANAHFEPADASGTQGTKTFEQSIVPTKAGDQKIPALRFSYFDPTTETYVTKTTAPIAVEIAQGNTAPPVVASTAPVADAPKANTDGLAADMAPTRATARLRPLVLAPWFITVNALIFAALIIGPMFAFWRQRRANDPRRLQREASEKSVHESLAAMDAALKVQDAPRFFTAARRALQERLAAQWQVPASRVTVSEIRSRLNRSGEGIRSVFQTADEIAYSGRRFTTPDLQQWRSVVQEQLHQIVRL
jgi:hypothetical protein